MPLDENVEKESKDLSIVASKPDAQPVAQDIGLSLQLVLPAIAEPAIVTIRDEIEKSKGNYLFAKEVQEAAALIKKEVKQEYDIYLLTRNELTELKQGLEKFVTLHSEGKIEWMFDFITGWMPDWDLLSSTEKSSLSYSRGRDRKSDPSKFKKMYKNREEKLAAIILKCFSKMTENADRYRIGELPVGIMDVGLPLNADGLSKILYVERFISEKVMGAREPIYDQTTQRNISEILKYHKIIAPIIGPEALEDLGTGYAVAKLTNLQNWYNYKNYYTIKQRKFALELMTQYVLYLQQAPDGIKQKIIGAQQQLGLVSRPLQLPK
jgi:hypothetical protein